MDDLTVLALAARDGNRLSLGSLIRRTQADVWRTCARLGPRDAADDLTQEVYVRMMRSLPNFRGDSWVRTWLIAIARNTAADALRAQRRRDHIQTLTNRSKTVEEPDHSVELRDLVADLDDAQREAFVLTQLLGLSYEETAAACKCPIGTIRSRVARARSRLLEVIDLTDDCPGTAAPACSLTALGKR